MVSPGFERILDSPTLTTQQRRRLLSAYRKALASGARTGIRNLGDFAINIREADVAASADLWAQARFPELISQVTDTTKSISQRVIEAGLQEGLGIDEIAENLEARFSDWASVDGKQSRAEMIARTETGEALNEATLQSYQFAGIREVHVEDGDQDEVCAAAVASSPWTVELAQAQKLGHPNCTRGFRPKIPGEVVD